MVQPLVSRPLGSPAEEPTPEPAPLPFFPEYGSLFEVADRFIASQVGQACIAREAARYAPIRQRLDDARDAMTPLLHTREGDVRVPLPFRMAVSDPSIRRLASAPQPNAANENEPQVVTAERKAPRLHSIGQSIGMSEADVRAVRDGRARPAQLRALAQAVIDAEPLPSGPGPLVDRVRTLLGKYGIGVDCAGYVQQALVRAAGTTRAALGLRSMANEDLSDLGSRGFKPVAHVTDLRPGDIVSLGPPSPGEPGHRVIVYDQHATTADEIARLGLATTPHAHLRTIVVDSSWGSGGDARFGGVERRTWFYNAISGEWVWTGPPKEDPHGVGVGRGPLPYKHPLIGFFRPPMHVPARASDR